MRKIVAILFLVLICGQSFSQVICYADYLMRKADYMEKCINKQRPLLKCNGQCQMMKKMLAQDEQNQPTEPQLKISAMPEIVSSSSSFLWPLPAPATSHSAHFAAFKLGEPTDRAYPLFHPPDLF